MTGGIEYREVVQSTAVGSGFTLSQFGDITSLLLSIGDWVVRGIINIVDLASLTAAQGALSINSGNTVTDHVVGDNQMDIPLVAVANEGSVSLFNRFSLSAETTIYLKAKLVGAVGNVVTGKIEARQMG